MPDAGQRAYDNVRHRLRELLEHLEKGSPDEKAFAAHLRDHLSIGLQCVYFQSEGWIWD
ncbi:MAG TPA: hypothetical protein VMU04_01270 [Candidatus Acidoferrum sp.]|nr:hypothetical protein [Candidatus Acidoferrum sp.]